MSLQQNVIPYPSHPLGWIPETNKFYDEKDSTEVEQKIVNVWFDTTASTKKFTLSEEDNGALVRLDLSQRWADAIMAANAQAAELIIELPVVKNVKPINYIFDFSMLDATANLKNVQSNITIKIIPNQGAGYTNAKFVGGCFKFDSDTSVKMVSPIVIGDGTFSGTGKCLQITTTASTGIKPMQLASTQLAISTCGMKDWTKYDSKRFGDATYTTTNSPSGDPVFWNVAGAFFGDEIALSFV